LYELIRNKESALCKLKKKYKEKKLKKLCDVDSDPLMENLSSSFCLETAFLAAILRNSRQGPQSRRWNFEEKVLALSLLKRSPKSYILLLTLLPLPSTQSLQPILNTRSVPFRRGTPTVSAENVW
jgi:hypothetical protein